MSVERVRNWSTSELGAIGLFAIFAAAMLPPGLWLVNEPTLIAGYPLLYVWAIGWGTYGTAALYWTVSNDLFGISTQHVPPEIAEREAVGAADSDATQVTAEGGDD